MEVKNYDSKNVICKIRNFIMFSLKLSTTNINMSVMWTHEVFPFLKVLNAAKEVLTSKKCGYYKNSYGEPILKDRNMYAITDFILDLLKGGIILSCVVLVKLWTTHAMKALKTNHLPRFCNTFYLYFALIRRSYLTVKYYFKSDQYFLISNQTNKVFSFIILL